MTTPTPNPPDQQTPAPPGKALRLARLIIALSLIVGVGVFGVLAINDLSKPLRPTNAAANTFGASDALPGQARETRSLPGDLPITQTNPLLGLAKNPNAIPIDHHPGSFKPFHNAAAYLQPPHREPVIDNVVWEFCTYQVKDATPQQAFDHYNQQATQAGMTLQKKGPTTKNSDGIMATWSIGPRSLDLIAWINTDIEPPAPPLKPTTPLTWVVKYSYPLPPDNAK